MQKIKIVIGVLVLAAIVVIGHRYLEKNSVSDALPYFSRPQDRVQSVENDSGEPTETYPADPKEETILKDAVMAAVNQKTKGQWDKKVFITRLNESEEAAVGSWLAKDYWDWLAWKDESAWKVLVSLDGFDCSELEQIPTVYHPFFQDVTTAPDGEKYCYSHK